MRNHPSPRYAAARTPAEIHWAATAATRHPKNATTRRPIRIAESSDRWQLRHRWKPTTPSELGREPHAGGGQMLLSSDAPRRRHARSVRAGPRVLTCPPANGTPAWCAFRSVVPCRWSSRRRVRVRENVPGPHYPRSLSGSLTPSLTRRPTDTTRRHPRRHWRTNLEGIYLRHDDELIALTETPYCRFTSRFEGRSPSARILQRRVSSGRGV